MVGLELKNDDKRIYLALSSFKNYRQNILELIREIQSNGYMTVFISINQPSAFLMDVFMKNGIDTNRIFFIDAITQYAGGTPRTQPDNCRFVTKPGDLTAMSIAVTEVLKRYPDQKAVIFLDSVNAMLIYSNSVDFTKFIHFVISKLRILNVSGIFLAVEKGIDPMLMSQFMAFTDELLEFPEQDTQ